MKPAIANAVLSRANHSCECCGSTLNIELDHFEGRARVEDSPETIWALCRSCHHRKTNLTPNAEWWLATWIQHCDFHGYVTSAARARARLFAVEVRAGFRKAVANG